MRRGCRRPSGAWAKVCLLLASSSLACGLSRHAEAREPIVLGAVGGEAQVVVYPARAPGIRRVTVVLHGMCGEAVNACRYFAEQVTADEHLLCPRATLRCDGGGWTWAAAGVGAAVERAVVRGEAALGPAVDASAGRTLIGYSLGAFRALEIAETAQGRYPRVMLIGAKILPSARLLRENGVQRLLLSAGELDMMHGHMRSQAKRLERAGFETRFLGLGAVGHALTPSFADYLAEALSWLRG